MFVRLITKTKFKIVCQSFLRKRDEIFNFRIMNVNSYFECSRSGRTKTQIKNLELRKVETQNALYIPYAFVFIKYWL